MSIYKKHGVFKCYDEFYKNIHVKEIKAITDNTNPLPIKRKAYYDKNF